MAVSVAHAAGTGEDQNDGTDDILGSLDGDALNELLAALDGRALGLFGGSDFMSVLSRMVNGDLSFDPVTILDFVADVIGTSITGLLSLLVTVIAVAIIYSIIGALKGGRVSEGVTKAVHFACIAAVIVVVGGATMDMFASCSETLGVMSAQIDTVFPIMLTLMAAAGASSTSSVFRPTLAVLTSGLFGLITAVLMPMLIAAFVFGIVGNISEEVKLGKTADFFHGSVKWLFGTGFFLLTAFMSVQGITASVFDGIAVRSARFTIGKFVPVIGGYLSEGFNLVMSGSVIVKNALGYTSLILLAATVLPVILQTGIYSLCLKLAAAATEPLGDKLMSDMLAGASKTVSMAGAVMTGAAFLYFVFILMAISTGNIFL